MIRHFLALLCIGFGVTSYASASSYTYSTAGCFTNPVVTFGSGTASSLCSSDGSTLTLNSQAVETISFSNQPSVTVTGNSLDLGLLAVTVSGVETAPAGVSASFGLAVAFTEPSGTTGSPFSGVLSGNVFGNAGGVTLTFYPQTVTFSDGNPADNFNLTLDSNPAQASSITGPSELTATLTPGDTPEPLSMGLLSGGFAVLGLLGLRRKIS